MAKNIVKLSLDKSDYTTRPYGTCSTAAATAAKVVDCADFNLATGATVLVKFTYANSASSPTLNVNSTGAKSIYYRGAALASSLYYWGAGDVVEFYYNGTQWDLLNVSNTNTTYSSLSAADATAGNATTGRLITAQVLHNKIVEMLPSVTQTATSGGEVGKITINGTSTTLYAPTQTSVSGNAGTATALANKRTIDGVNFDGTANISHFGTCSTAAGTAAKTVDLTDFTLATGSRIAVKFTVTNTATNPTLNVNGTGAKAIMYRGSGIGTGYLAANRVYEFVYDGTDYELVGDLDTNTTYSGDRGISLVSGKLGHSNTKLTAKTAYGSTGTTAAAAGGTFTVTDVKYDEYGHITGSTDRTITLSETYTGTVTSVKLIQGTGITVSNSGTAITGSGERTISLNTATTEAIGGIKIAKDNTGYSVTANTSSLSADASGDKYYGVEIDKNDKAFVYVPWSNTKNTAGSTDSSSKLFLVGATSQAASPQTYSHDTVYVDTDGHLYSDSKQVVNLSGTQALTNKTYEGYTLAAACAKGVTTSVAANNTSLVTSGAVYTAIANSFAANDAMVFKGVVNSNSDLPASHSAGYTYRVGTAGTYLGSTVCEIGDLIICITDGTSANNAHWIVAQTNINGAVINSETSVTENTVAIFSGTTGKIVKSSGFTIGKSVPSNALFTDTNTKVNVTLATTSKAYLIGVTSAPTATAAAMTAVSDTGVYLDTTAGQLVATTFKGALDGNATTATTATKSTIENLTPPSSNTSYYNLFYSAVSGTGKLIADEAWRTQFQAGTTSATGWARIVLGNDTGSGTAGNMEGRILLYSTSTSYHAICGAAVTSAVTHTLPATGGTILNSGTSSVSKSGETLTVKINNTSQSLTNVDTKNTAGATNSSSKLFLIGATKQEDGLQTYSHDTAYVGTDGCLYSNSTKVSVEGHTHKYAASSEAGGAATSANKLNTDAGSSSKPVYFSNGVPVECTSITSVGILSKSVTKAITTSWADILTATELNTLLTEGAGTYIIQVYGATSIGYSSGIMSWHTSGSTNDEILLHRTGASTNIYLRLSSRALQIAGSADVASQSISIKFKKLI